MAAKGPKGQAPQPRRAVVARLPKRAQQLTLAVVGDIMAHGEQVRTAYNPGCQCHQFRPVFKEVRPYLAKADLAIGNLETTLPGPQAGYSRNHSLVFGAPDALAEALAWAGFDVLSTANNHICDKGFPGLNRTLSTLTRFGFTHFGAYPTRTAHKERRFLMLQRRGWRLALLSYTTHVNGCLQQQGRVNLLYWPRVRRDIALARKQKPDAIIVLFHFGKEYAPHPNAAQRGAVLTAIDAGADLIFGSHTHTLQPYKLLAHKDASGITKPRLVAYSLGNFVSNMSKPGTTGGAILHVTLERTTRSYPHHMQITNIRHTPLWVYKKRRGDEIESFHILPTLPYMAGKGAQKLPAAAMLELRQFHKDANIHLWR